MPATGWLELFSAALGGGLTVKVADIAYQEIRRRLERSRTAEEFVDTHLDPLMKAADELVGKLRSLAESDFKELHNVDPSSTKLKSPDFSSMLFLFARFWARIEVFRKDGMSVATSRDKRGEQLNKFLDCLESRRVRVVDRITQRAIGEAMTNDDSTAMGFIAFVKAFEVDEETRRWLSPITSVLARTRHTTERQRLLQYGAVVHAMIDTIDPKHLVTRERPSYPNKLSRRSWRDLKYRVFGLYLSFADSKKYLGEPSKRRRGR